MSPKTSIKCPNCNTDIDVDAILYQQIENESIQKIISEKKKFEQETRQKRKEYAKFFADLQKKEESFKKKESKFDENLKKTTDKQVKMAREKYKQEIQNQQRESYEIMQKELEEKSAQLRNFNKTKTENEKLKRDNKEIESRVQANIQKNFSKKLIQTRQDIQEEFLKKNELKFKEKDEQLKQITKQLEQAQRKAQQGSMQMQGEVQELAIEEYLQKKYPFDVIEEIKKGVRGADCIQIVHTRGIQNCGKIYYESKRTKEFHKSWIEKFKKDMREIGADMGILVTQSLPKDLNRMNLVDGIWVCTFEEFKGLSAVIRQGIIKIHQAKRTQENRKGKMSLLYGYLTSNEFKMQIEAIVEGFSQLQNDLDTEKRAMNKIWKQREKQISKVLYNTSGMYGSIKGIAGNAITNIKALELPFSD